MICAVYQHDIVNHISQRIPIYCGYKHCHFAEIMIKSDKDF